ncbi:MAG: Rpn family recombination-promoting nuclease/putative transposase [Chloroherpetonaceae bacterium]
MHTDKLIYLILQHFPQGFFALIGRTPDDALHYTFKSVELKEVAFRIDGLFIPDSDDTTYFVEAQFQRDEQFYARFFAEIFLYLKQYPTRQWNAVVIYSSRSAEQKDLEGYRDLLALKQVKRIYLDELPPMESVAVSLLEMLIVPKKELGALARKIAARADKVQMELLLNILAYKNLTEAEVKAMLEIEEALLKDTPFYKEVFAKGKAEGRLEGEQKGRLEGEQKGEQKGKLAAVPILRELGLSDEQIAEKLQLPLANVQSVSRT